MVSEICTAYILEAVLKRSGNVQPIKCRPFGCHKDALPWKATSANGNACLGLVCVVLGGICPNNVTKAQFSKKDW